MDSSGRAMHAPHKLAASQHHYQQHETGPFPGFSHSETVSDQSNILDRRAPGELSCWEKRLKSAQEKLQLMRMEREQWYAMASVADSAKKQSQKGISLCTLSTASFCVQNLPRYCTS